MKSASRSTVIRIVAAVCLLQATVFGQKPTDQQDDVLRVNTDLVQTDFMVFDKQGNFIDGLKREQFVLKVDGKLREISSFDRLNAGSRSEEAQLAAARGTANSTASATQPLDRGRTVMFFLDDLHLSLASLDQTKKLLKIFIDREMGQNDLAQIASTSGQVGFLQQLTNNKAVLNAAVNRLHYQQVTPGGSAENPPMSEYRAMLIEQGDEDVLNYFVDALLKQIDMPRGMAIEMVKGRASALLKEASSISTRSMATFKNWIDQKEAAPGRKLVFFISDGFLLDEKNSDNYDRLQRITSAAARAGTVIYSIDARGLTTGVQEASSFGTPDPTGRLARSALGEIGASQDVLNALAVDTGGRPFFNRNDLPAAVTVGLKETSSYYLLAWRPDNDEQRNPKYRRIEISIVNRPELVVRFRRGFADAAAETGKSKAQTSPSAQKTASEQISNVLRAPYAQTKLPIAISLNYLDSAQYGATLTTTMRVSTGSLPIELQNGVPTALVDVAGAVFDDQGKSVSAFNKRFTIKGNSGDAADIRPPESVLYNHVAIVKPGLYQVRIAALDVKQGTSGSVYDWIEIPDLQSHELTMSSLVVGENKSGTDVEFTNNNPNEPQSPAVIRQVSLNVDHRFARTSALRFLTFIYNALAGPASTRSNEAGATSTEPDVAVQVQVFRDNEPVITTPLHALSTKDAADKQRIPYAADVILDSLKPGAYVLHVTAIDRRAKSSASQQFRFYLE